MKKILLCIALTIPLAGCFGLGRETERPPTVFRPLEIPNVRPSPMSLQEVEWQVYTVSELQSAVDELESTGQTDAVFYLLTKEEFDSLVYNLAEMRRFIEDQKATNEYLVEAIRINNDINTPEE